MTVAALLAGCGGGAGTEPTAATAPPSASSTTATSPTASTAASTPTASVVTPPSEGDELPALPSGDVTVADLPAARALCDRYRREPEKFGARRQFTLRTQDGIDGIVCLRPS